MNTYKAGKARMFTVKPGRIRLLASDGYKISYRAHPSGKSDRAPLIIGINDSLSEEDVAYLLDDFVKYLRRKKKQRRPVEKIFMDVS